MTLKNLERFYLWSIKAFIFVIPLLPLYVSSSMLFPYITGKNFAFRILVEIAGALWLGLVVLSKEYRLKNSAVLLAVLIFTFITGLASLTGINPYISLWSGYERMEGYLTILHLCLYFMIIKSVFKTRKDWMVFMNIFALVSIYPDIIILLQKFGYFLPLGKNFPPGGPLGNPAFLSGYLLLVMFIKILLIINTERIWVRAIYITAIALDLLIIYYMATRSAILAVVGGVIIFSLFYIFGRPVTQRDKLFRKIAISITIATLILLIGFYVFRDIDLIKQSKTLSRFSTISTSDPSIKFRLLVYGMAWEGIKERPILGWGQESALTVYTKYYDPRIYGLEAPADRAHNIVFDWLINAGIMGLLSYLSLFGIAIYSLWSAHRKKLISRNEAVIITTAFTSYFFNNLFIFDTISTYMIFFALLAYVDSLDLSVTHNSKLLTLNSNLTLNSKLKLASWRSYWSLSITVLALMLFSLTAYFIHYKPIKESQLAMRLMVYSSEYKSFSTLLDDFKKALSYRSFGDRDVKLQMGFISDNILHLRLFTREGAPEFIRTTVVELENLIAANPENLGYMLPFANLLNRIAGYDPSFIKRAEFYIKECIRLSPKNPDVYLALAENYVLKRDFENAFLSVQKAAALNPSSEVLQLRMVMVALLTSREALADTILEKIKNRRITENADISAGIKPVFSESELLKFAQLSMSIGDFAKALKFYKEIIAIFPEKPQYRLEIAQVYNQLSDKKNAIKEAKKASEIDPNYSKEVERFIQSLK